MVLSAIPCSFFPAQYSTLLCAHDGDDANLPFFFHLETRIVVFRQSLPIEGESTDNVFVALLRDEPGQ
jgi:hypothetical protein